MSIREKVLTAVLLSLGSSVIIYAAAGWQNPDLGQLLPYLLAAIAAAAVRIRLSGMKAVLSLHFVVVLICLPRLRLPEVLLIAASGSLMQSWLAYRPLRWAQTGLDTCMALLSAAGAFAVYQRLLVYQMAEGATPQLPLLLVASACAYFFIIMLPAALLAADAEKRPFPSLWRDRYFWTFPHYMAGGAAAGWISALLGRGGWDTLFLILPVIYWMYNSYRYYLQMLEDEHQQVRELGGLHFRTLEALSLAIEGNDPTKHVHLRRVSTYVIQVGRQMHLTGPELQALHAASMLHDIGKLAVPEHIVTKPGRLTDVEFETMKIHTVAGAEILEQVRFPYPVAPIVRAHHEKWDGTGYPLGLKGETIPIGARILAAVDCLDALISDRYHRPALPMQQAIEHLKRESGKSFDPSVVAILVERYPELELRVQNQETDVEHLIWIPGDRDQAKPSAVQESLPSGRAPFLRRIAAARQEEQQSFHLARELGNSLSLDETLAVCASRIGSMCPQDAIGIFILRDGILTTEHTLGEEIRGLRTGRIPLGSGLVGKVAESRSPLLNVDPRQEETTLGGPSTPMRSTPMRSALLVPLEGLHGVVGVIAFYARLEQAFTTDHLRIVAGVAPKAGLAIENALKYSHAQISATTDSLTGLPNSRSLFLHLDAELSRAKRQNGTLTVLVGDLDGFKQINDELGHMEGNRLLRSVGQALKNQCREYDFVARMGGDEFVLVLPNYRPRGAEAKAAQLREAVERESVASVGEKGIGLSLGHASFPEDGMDAETLLAVADRRMYEVKAASAHRLEALAVTHGLGVTDKMPPTMSQAMSTPHRPPAVAGSRTGQIRRLGHRIRSS